MKKIPKQEVFYTACYHNEEEGRFFEPVGFMGPSKREALKTIKERQPGYEEPLFLAEVITRPVRKSRRTSAPRRRA